jgi:transglutaminase/protease-like cytokinesis protein 3
MTALILAVSMVFAGCQKVDSNPIPTDTTTAETTVSLTKMTETTTTPPEILTTTTVTTTTATETTTVPETTTISETTTVSETGAAAQSSSNGKWTEVFGNRTMYTNQTCYSRVEASLGAQIVKEYSQGTPVEIVATTDTGYCKLSDGTYIHSDYLSTSSQGGPGTTATFATTVSVRPATTTAANQGSSGNTAVSNYNGNYKSRYFWGQLSDAEQQLYADIVTAAENYDTSYINTQLNSLNIRKIYFLVFNNEPQLFWIDNNASITFGKIALKYCVAQSDIPTIQAEINSSVNSIMNKASGMSNLNKIKVFYDWIVLNNNFDLNNSAANCGIEHGLRPGSGNIQCNGYAKTMQYLCDTAGIPCVTIEGESTRGATHGWNKLQLNGKWYNIDPTRGDPAVSYGSNYISYNYYLVPDAWIAESHLMENQRRLSSGDILHYFNTPSATDSSLNYFRLYNKEFSTTDSAWNGLCAELKSAIESGKNTAHIRVTDPEIYETLTSKTYWKAAQDYARTIKSGITLKPQTTDLDGVMSVQYNFEN